MVDIPFAPPEDSSPEMKLLFEAAQPIRNAILSTIVKSNGDAFDSKAAILSIVSHLSLHLVKFRPIEHSLALLWEEISRLKPQPSVETSTKDFPEASPEAQSETNLENGLGSGDGLPPSSHPTAP